MGSFYPLAGCLKRASLLQTDLATSKLHLFKDTLSPDPSTPLADYTSAEADFSGYPSGGATITAFLNPLLDPLGGAGIAAPTVQFEFTAPSPPTPPVTNNVGGWYLVDGDGDLIAVGTFPSPIAIESAGQGVDVNITLIELTGQTP